jgi:hypothetical protein
MLGIFDAGELMSNKVAMRRCTIALSTRINGCLVCPHHPLMFLKDLIIVHSIFLTRFIGALYTYLPRR